MGFDSIAKHASIASALPKDCAKKKRGNRTAKLKQCKLDARREQWLSQGAVKNKGVMGEKDDVGALAGNERECSLENLVLRGRDREREGLILRRDSDLGSLSNSPTSPLNGGVLGGNASRSNYGGSSSSSGGSWSGSITEEEEDGDDDCLDDWEAVADALAANDKQEKPELPPQNENSAQLESESHCKVTDASGSANENLNSELPRAGVTVPVNSHAWRPDDAFRPQCLPNLSKQRSMPNSDRQHGYRGVPWAYNSVKAVPSLCPICCDDFDVTDAKFLPCLCGFHLCLFCYKRILEEDGRCPGCRKPYEHEPVEMVASVHGGITLTRSRSMITRS